MRTYGRITNEDGTKSWVVVETDENGFNDSVYLTTLAQAIQLNIGESPFYANVGIPQQQTVFTQVFPDFYMNQLQTLFAPFFASLVITKVQSQDGPFYQVDVLTNSGANIGFDIPI